MNKYEKAFKVLEDELPYTPNSPLGKIKELVERATPKKVIKIREINDTNFYIGNCPVCHNPVTSESNYCNKQGQALDWSKGNE